MFIRGVKGARKMGGGRRGSGKSAHVRLPTKPTTSRGEKDIHSTGSENQCVMSGCPRNLPPLPSVLLHVVTEANDLASCPVDAPPPDLPGTASTTSRYLLITMPKPMITIPKSMITIPKRG